MILFQKWYFQYNFKGEYMESRFEKNELFLTFSPNNCTFKKNKYKDLLIVESFDEYWSFEIFIELVNNLKVKSSKWYQLIMYDWII